MVLVFSFRLSAQNQICTFVPQVFSRQIPRNACLQLSLSHEIDSCKAAQNKLETAFLYSEYDTIPLKVIASFPSPNGQKFLLRPTAWLTPLATYHLAISGHPAFSEAWHSSAAFAEDLVAFRVQPALKVPGLSPTGPLEICLSLHAAAWHWLRIEIVNKWTGRSQVWLEGKFGAKYCLEKPAGYAWYGPGAQAGDEFDIFITPISIDGAEGRRSEPISVVLD